MYKTIDAAFWNDPDVRALSNEAKLLLMFLITNPDSHFTGLFYMRPYIPLNELNWEPAMLTAALAELSDTPIDRGMHTGIDTHSTHAKQHYFIKFDTETTLIWVKSMLRHQCGDKPLNSKQLKGVISHIRQFKPSPIVFDFLAYHAPFLARTNRDKDTGKKKEHPQALLSEIQEFYAAHGLDFSMAAAIPLSTTVAETTSASATATSLFASPGAENESEHIFRVAERLFGKPLQRNLPIRNVDYACQQIAAGQLKASSIKNPDAYLCSAAAYPGPDYKSYHERKAEREAKRQEAQLKKDERPDHNMADPAIREGLAALAAGKRVEVR
jgi:hypothetical protein